MTDTTSDYTQYSSVGEPWERHCLNEGLTNALNNGCVNRCLNHIYWPRSQKPHTDLCSAWSGGFAHIPGHLSVNSQPPLWVWQALESSYGREQCLHLKASIMGSFRFHKSPQNIRPFCRYSEILFLGLFKESGQGRMRDCSFHFLVPGLLPVSSFISAVPKTQPWNGVRILCGAANQHRKVTTGCWWHSLSRTVFYCFYSITSNWKVSQIFLRQLSDIYT